MWIAAPCLHSYYYTTTHLTPSTMSGVAHAALGQFSKNAEGAEALYDEWAESYDEALSSWHYPVPGRVAETLLSCNVPTDGSIVDLGCGTGMSGEAIRAKFTGSLTGLDISSGSLKLIGEKKPNVYTSTHVANLDKPLDMLKDGPYDAFVSVGVFSYVEKFDVLFQQIASLLKPGGVLIFSHHVAYWDDDRRGNRTVAEDMQAKGIWKIESVGEGEAYMPNNPDPAENSKRIRIIVLRKN